MFPTSCPSDFNRQLRHLSGTTKMKQRNLCSDSVQYCTWLPVFASEYVQRYPAIPVEHSCIQPHFSSAWPFRGIPVQSAILRNPSSTVESIQSMRIRFTEAEGKAIWCVLPNQSNRSMASNASRYCIRTPNYMLQKDSDKKTLDVFQINPQNLYGILIYFIPL